MYENLILVDTTYTSFYRYFATIRWISHDDPELYNNIKIIENYDWINNKKFMDKYEKMYIDSIKKIVGKKIYEKSNIIFCIDDKKENLWRTKLMKNYKSGRNDLAVKYNFSSIFRYTHNMIIPTLIADNYDKISKIKINKLEADDIIAITCNFFGRKNPELNIHIISSDEDFYQLGRNNVYFINYKSKKSMQLSKEQAHLSLQYKIIMGDPSDGILSIFHKIKIPLKTKRELIIYANALDTFLKNNKIIKERYELNKKLIDFHSIPKNLQKLVINELKIKLKI